jgi:hypothetical protein
MAKIFIKVEIGDINITKLGDNIKIDCGNVDIIFSPEALNELIKDYNEIKKI